MFIVQYDEGGVVEVQDFSYDSAPQPIALLARAGESMEYQCCSEGLKRK